MAAAGVVPPPLLQAEAAHLAVILVLLEGPETQAQAQVLAASLQRARRLAEVETPYSEVELLPNSRRMQATRVSPTPVAAAAAAWARRLLGKVVPVVAQAGILRS